MAHQAHQDFRNILESPLFRLETVFSRVTDNLFTASDKATGLKTAVGQLVEVTTPAKLTKVSEGLDEVQQLRQSIDTMIQTSQGFVHHIAANRRKMNADLKDLAENIHSAGIVSLNARIIAQGHRALKQGEQLVRLAENISGITESASGQVTEMLKATEAITRALTNLTAMAEDRAVVLADRSLPDMVRTDEILSTLHRGMTSSQDGAKWLSDYLGRIEYDVMRVIEVLQIGDRARQRAEHIQQILNEARSFPEGSVEQNALRKMARAQLQQAAEHTLQSAEKGVKHLSGLASELQTYNAHCSALQKSFRGKQGMVADSSDLESRLEQFRSVSSCSDNTKTCMTTIFDYENALHQYSKELGNAAFSMQLASLNTIIACAREGRAAADMIVISQQVNSVVSTVPELFESFTGAYEQTKTELNGYMQVSSIDANAQHLGEAAVEVLPALAHALSDLLPRLSGDAEQLARAVAAADQLLASLVTDLRASLKGGNTNPGPRIPTVAAEARFYRSADRLRRTYTMEEERTLHDEILEPLLRERPDGAPAAPVKAAAPKAAAPAPAPAAEAADDDLSDILF